MKNKTKGLIAGVAGIALLTGGSTFALWSAQDSVAGGTITNGDLNVTAAAALSWVDTSADRTDADHVINLSTWRMVPGDTAEGTVAVDVTLIGDNLAAELALTSTAPVDLNGLELSYEVYKEGDTTTPVATGAYGAPAALRFAANTTSQETTSPTTILVESDGTTTLTVVITASFADTGVTQARDDVNAATALGNLGVSLTQVREDAGFTTP
ncbi:alternate-type signal peptide domain-containing protein [Cellulomonas sp. Sa3CUA2]|uniref:Alternate-type signal peptide domain-containing protein n=1 Tax=Cellulomonas avistercoris TaxID=2762242 RepID=A0ABR8QDE4_9CELL|nr:alternate-type signal peptide domain-containing protein [Cellulomonas avistercoris]MBD7918324.1 alternate-type signal peptide domain-containing protein [Cellulomonas avistercoris]